MKKIFNFVCIAVIATAVFSCDSFIDVVPDNTADIEKAFKLRAQAQKFLYTTYSYLNPATTNQLFPFVYASGATVASSQGYGVNHINRGRQKITNPYRNYWEGRNEGKDLYEAIRKCNTFLNNIHKVGNMTLDEKKKWAAEVKFLKAYYHFLLIRMYGPIVLYKDNLSPGDPASKIKIARAPVDSAFAYVKRLMSEAINTPQLPDRISNTNRNLGRITKTIAYAMKAKVEVFAASPLFNGNSDYKGFQNVNGNNPFNTEKNPAKWDSAAAAAKKAVDFAETHNFHLYKYQTTARNDGISDSTKLKMTIRNSFTRGQGKPNPGVLWIRASEQTRVSNYYAQVRNIPRGINNNNPSHYMGAGRNAPTFKMINKFYTEHGLPIEQDKTWDYSNRFNVETVGENERFYLRQGYKTAKLNFHREARYYASLGFDGSIWYGNGSGVYKGGPDKYITIRAKEGQINAVASHQGNNYSLTGYWAKKLVNYNTVFGDQGSEHTIAYYNKPIIRLADLYLLYAEAKNEADGPGPQVYSYINRVRKQAGLPTVQEAWSKWGNGSAWDYTTKKGMRKIIQRERSNELAFEGKRFWDLRRWKTAPQELNEPIRGWSIKYSEPEQYYNPRIVLEQNFRLKDYFWPISELELTKNPNLTQNPGW